MNGNILILEGKINHLGASSTNEHGITTWETVRILTDAGNEIFIPKNKTDAKMGAYVKDSLGQQVKIFYSEFSVGKAAEAAIFAIRFNDGRAYDKGPELDSDVKKIKKMLFMGRTLEVALIVMIVCLTISVIGIIIAAPLAYALWKLHKGLKDFSKIIANFPTTKQFQQFYDKHNREAIHAEYA